MIPGKLFPADDSFRQASPGNQKTGVFNHPLPGLPD